MAGRSYKPLGDVLPSVLSRLGLDQKFKEQTILTLWPEVVGEEIAARSEATRIHEGVLYVRAEPGAWMQELHFMERELLQRLRKKAPGVKLSRIHFSAREYD